jgi:peptidoglycan/LPS O-acetylase OafA/YrhL
MANDRNRSLDGLRALAVSLVLVSHGFGLQPRFLPWPDRFTPVWPGSMGVRIFFVLSGWLITGILLRARDEASAFGVSRRRVWLAFYMRRCCRIFPLAYFAILVAFIADVQNVREHLRWYLFYGSNVLAAYQGDNVGELGHLWSLAVEEQFYLVWPLVVLLVPMSRLPSLILTLIAGSVVLRGLIYAFWTPHGDLAAYVLTVSRFDALGIGGFLAVRPLSVRTLSISGIAIVACGAVLPSALSAALTEFGLGLALRGARAVSGERLGLTSLVGLAAGGPGDHFLWRVCLAHPCRHHRSVDRPDLRRLDALGQHLRLVALHLRQRRRHRPRIVVLVPHRETDQSPEAVRALRP